MWTSSLAKAVAIREGLSVLEEEACVARLGRDGIDRQSLTDHSGQSRTCMCALTTRVGRAPKITEQPLP